MDLTKVGNILFVGLLGVMFAIITNIFIGSSTFDLVISMITVVIFTALTAVDTQRIIKLASDPKVTALDSSEGRIAVLGALTLYLDFINIFVYLLRILGRRR